MRFLTCLLAIAAIGKFLNFIGIQSTVGIAISVLLIAGLVLCVAMHIIKALPDIKPSVSN